MTKFSSFIKFKTLILFCLFLCFVCFSYGSTSEKDSKTKYQTVVLPKFRLGAQIGYAYRFLPEQKYYSPPNQQEYDSKFKNNLCYGVDITYYFLGNYLGLGLKYNGTYTQAKQAKIKDWPDGTSGILPISEKIGIHYIGAYLSGRYFVKPNKHCLFANAGAGLSIYRNKATFMYYGDYITDIQRKLSIESIATFSAEIGYDFFVTKSLAIGVQITSSVGLHRKRAPVDYLGVTVGIRYNKY